jgi:hypothetical protein
MTMPEHHATLGPSAAARWIQCPASIRMSQQVPKTGDGGPYAAEGTMAHLGAELMARQLILGQKVDWSQWKPSPEQREEMFPHIMGWVELLRERMRHRPNTQLLLEQRLDTGLPRCWGTGDAVLVSPEHVEIIDLKYGQGIAVRAENNPQLMLYGVGALDNYGDLLGDVERVHMTIYQPRLGRTSTWDIDPAALRSWRDGLLPIAEEALGDDAHFAPSETACRFCPAAGVCRARVEKMTQLDFTPVRSDLIDNTELGELLALLPEVKSWADAVADAALHRMYSEGQPVPGYKVVRSGGKRSIVDNDEAVVRLVDAGYRPEQVSTMKINTLGALEKLVGKAKLPELLGDVLVKGEGSPSVVPESDSRPAISPETGAREDFS